VTYEVIVRPEAELDLVEAVDWYEQRQPGLGPVSLRQVEDVADWAVGQNQKINPDRVAWIGARPQLRMVQRKTWKNPQPEKTIREIDFVSARGPAAPYLIAVTAE
jgi:hypothetical protein